MDTDRAGLIECVLHELLHICLDLGTVLDYELEESVIVALEIVMCQYVKENPRRLASVRKTIYTKLPREG